MNDTKPPQPPRKFIAALVITFAGASGSVVIEDLGLIGTQHAVILASLFFLAFVATILVAKRRNDRNADDSGHLNPKTVDKRMPLEPYQRRRLRILTPEPAVVYLLALGVAALAIQLYGVTTKAAIVVGVGVSLVFVWQMVYGLYLLSKKLKFEADEGLYWEN